MGIQTVTLKSVLARDDCKNAKQILLIDNDKKPLPMNRWFGSSTVLLMQKSTDNTITIKIEVYNSIPRGWKPLYGGQTQPRGFEWICNSKSIFSPERRIALMRMMPTERSEQDESK